ncbi:MAG: sulfotransferase [Pacificimonas sp.]|jgi:tetratricopeptide (TPR) repeat protein|nr:sulfotransferase [Pacificimonas sp.]
MNKYRSANKQAHNHQLRAALTSLREMIGKRAFEDAKRLLVKTQKEFPHEASVYLLGSALGRATGSLAFAKAQAERVLDLDPEHVEGALDMAELSHLGGDIGRARVLARRAVQSQPPFAQLDRAAAILTRVGEHAEALKLYSRMIEDNPDLQGAYHNRAMVRRFLGDIVGAERDLDRALDLAPGDSEAQLARSGLRRQTASDNHIDALRKLERQSLPWANKVQVKFALAKELEDLGEYSGAFDMLSAANELRRRHLRYDVQDDVATIDHIITRFDGAFFQNADEGDASALPVFVLGLPRSGTTLTERIIGSHGEAEALGELDSFPKALITLASQRMGAGRGGKNAMVDASLEIDPAELGREYLRLTQPWRSTEHRFVDKLPMNYLYLGLIAAALPNARIVEVRRHPMANCYAMFKTLFKAGYPFSYALTDLAAYYAAYDRLMAHWRDLLGERIVQVRYEDLVSAQEVTSRDLLRQIDFTWDEACIDFHRNAAPSTTQSASQVRQPIYTSSRDQWRNYENQLAPLKNALIQHGVAAADLH